MTPGHDRFERALAECAREPIQIPGAIQPSGVLLVYHRADQRILAASSNALELFDCGGMEQLLHQRFDELVDHAVPQAIDAALARGEAGMSQFVATVNVGALGALHDLSTHAAGDLVHVELEPSGQGAMPPGGHALVAGLDAAGRGEAFLQCVAAQVQRLSGYGRAMVYRFLPDGSGEVVAEALAGGLASYDGLRYPASDIPPQARALYLRNRVRVIADVDAPPLPVLQSAELGAPLDMSFDVLRAVSPVHLQYLRNMGVRASMSISLVVEGRLWGLVACHHGAPRPLDARQRMALDMVGRYVSTILDAHELRARAASEGVRRRQRDALESRLHRADGAASALPQALEAALGSVEADGLALRIDEAWHTHGEVPDDGGLRCALAWATAQGRGGAAATIDAAAWHAGASAGACGLFAMPLGRRQDWLLLFRREQRETVRWAGRPDAPFQVDPDGTHIGPRTSFEAWSETVRGRSAPWSGRDFELARRLRMVLERHVTDAQGWAGTAGSSDGPAADLPMRRWDAREQADRLRRLADLLHDASPDREPLQRMRALLGRMEEELGALADAAT